MQAITITPTTEITARIKDSSDLRIEIGTWLEDRWVDKRGNPVGGFAFAETAEVDVERASYGQPGHQVSVSFSSTMMDAKFAARRAAIFAVAASLAEFLEDDLDTTSVAKLGGRAIQYLRNMGVKTI